MEKTGQGVLSQNDLMQRLVQAKKVLNKVETGEFERGNVNEEILRSNPEDIQDFAPNNTIKQPQTPNIQKIQESKLPDAIKRAMIENPIPQISLNDSLDFNFIEKTKKLMESEGLNNKKTSQPSKSSSVQSNSSDLVKQLTPIIENIVRKTVMEIMDAKLNQILTAQQTLSINENLVLKVGDSVFKGKITGVNKSK